MCLSSVSIDSHLDCSKTSFWQRNSVTIHLHCDVSKPGNRGSSTVLVFGLHTEEGQPCYLPAGPSQQVGAGPLEVIEEAIEGVIVGVSEYHTSAGASGLAVKGSFQLLTGFKLPTRSLLTLHLIIDVEAATPL